MGRPKKSRRSGEAFAKLLEERGFSSYKLARKLEVGTAHITRIVNGEIASPKLATLQSIARALEVELDVLTRIFDPPPDDEERRNEDLEDLSAKPCQDWGEAPDVSEGFYGRTEELATLEQWIVNERCRLVAIAGMPGIGKSVLSVRLAEQIQERFDYIMWRSLRCAPPLSEISASLAELLPVRQEIDIQASDSETVSRIIDYLRQHRCLLILDSAETVLRGGNLAGYYVEGYSSYGELFRRAGEASHISCLVVTSQEKPKEIAVLEGKTAPVRSLQVTGLSEEAAREILESKGLLKADNWVELIKLYRGNPLALKIVSTTIQDLFGGSVSEFLKQSTLFMGDFSDVLSQPFNHLSDPERQIMYWLAICREPVELAQLRDYWASAVSHSQLIKALEYLVRKGLLEKVTEGITALFTLQPVIMKYVTAQLIDRVCQDIFAVVTTHNLDKLGLLRSHSLSQSQAPESVKANQLRFILTPIKNRLYTLLSSERSVEEQFQAVLILIQGKSPQTVGYAEANILSLIAMF